MQKFWRYLLAGWMVVCMTVDTASAGRLFRSLCCRPACRPARVEVCPPVESCSPVECCTEATEEDALEASPPAPSEPQASAAGSSTREPVAPRKAAADPPAEREHDLESAAYNEPTPAPLPMPEPVSEPTPEPAPVAPAPSPVVAPQPISENEAPENETASAPESEAPATNETKPEPSIDSLFDEPTTPAPETVLEVSPPEAVLPEENSPADDLFDLSPAPGEEPKEADGNSLFDAPATELNLELTPEEGPPIGADQLDVDSLFPPTVEESPATSRDSEAPAESTDTEERGSSEVEDLFGQQQPSSLDIAGLTSPPARRWSDRKARFGCEAQLLRLTSKAVVLLKTDGRKVAVPFSRLSDSDLHFVHQQAVLQRELLAKRSATEQLASLWSE